MNIYIRDASEFIKFMKLNDPSIETVIVGCDDINGWNKPVLDALNGMTNYLSYHENQRNQMYKGRTFYPAFMLVCYRT